MICPTCLHGPLRGYVILKTTPLRDGRSYDTMTPCPDCGGSGIAHSCEGERPVPKRDEQ